ncbi:MAG: hypothetical protein CL670_11135 [Balneola sp.]|mgnify:CR=1 FL=1|jgi:hypothetical protein|nr:hypothetical protein [Balneola sp.]MBE79699.1 hypothetical protein [Balneola sp.]HBX67723.1 hypothetical protein [Balneolaceae bacterium]|tara:strand:+ start:526 stop:1143 length:618 start_codon:yes stop_codon:yes gene_type:complete
MNVDLEQIIDKALPHIKKWWFSVVCIPFCWVLANQFWMALKWEITFSWIYDYPLFLSPFFFLIDNFLLIVHEAGHTFLGFFGSRFITILGGTLFEIMLPFMIFIYGWWNYSRLVAQIGLLLTAFAWIESSAYAADAFARRMPLLGNLPKSAHDFYNMLSMHGILDHYMTVAWTMYWIGIITLLLFFFWPLLERKKYDYVNIKMNL